MIWDRGTVKREYRGNLASMCGFGSPLERGRERIGAGWYPFRALCFSFRHWILDVAVSVIFLSLIESDDFHHETNIRLQAVNEVLIYPSGPVVVSHLIHLGVAGRQVSGKSGPSPVYPL
jgi:hypothetical protein